VIDFRKFFLGILQHIRTKFVLKNFLTGCCILYGFKLPPSALSSDSLAAP